MPESGQKTEATKTENVMMTHGKRDLERVGGDGRTTIRGNVGREK